MFPRHGEFLPPFSAQLRTGVAPFNWSPEGGGEAKTLEWTTSAQEAFQNAKRLLAAAVPLQHPAPNAELSLATDASDTHIGGVMQQKSCDHWRPRQQRHLAFISEFNVQMLYLPGLKNIVADFLSYPPPTPPPRNLLKQSPPRRRQIQWILKLWLLSQTAVRKHSACLAVHPSKWPFAKQALNTSLVMCQQEFFAPLSHRTSEKASFSIFTIFHIRGGSPPSVWYLLGLSGEGSPQTSPPGREPASTASRPRFIATPACSCSLSPSCSGVFLIYTLIWWDPYSTVAVAISFLLSLIAHPNGSKPFLCLTCPLWHALKLYFFLDFPFWSARNDHFRSRDAIYFNIWSKLCKMLHISHPQTTAYHPELNGAVERLHCRLRDALRAHAAAATWSKELPFVLLDLRA